MNLFKQLWRDEAGAILSTEAVLLGTVGVVGASVGIGAIGESVNEELKESAFAFRSLDQSYSIRGYRSCRAWTAGATYIPPDIERSHAELQDWIDRHEAAESQPEPAHEEPAVKLEPVEPRAEPIDERAFDRQRREYQEEMRRRREEAQQAAATEP